MSNQVKISIKNFTMEELDYQFDEKSNKIDALTFRIISSEKFHQVCILEERKLNEEQHKLWEPARSLDLLETKNIKGPEIT
ncbi:hypothetical protein AAGF08_08040 [Algoriphagus sp. SE2]|uniref:hypothetical protein n=1 Tax=Algoriphagus sp. SE2 TaxID=3141536 RepID=UPI0031CD10A4